MFATILEHVLKTRIEGLAFLCERDIWMKFREDEEPPFSFRGALEPDLSHVTRLGTVDPFNRYDPGLAITDVVNCQSDLDHVPT